MSEIKEIKLNESIEKLKCQLDKDPKLTDKDKDIYLMRAKASHKISEAIADLNIEPIETLRILMGMACGMTVHCDEPFNAIAYTLDCMSEFYKFYEVSRHGDGKKG
jgi:hypothetical protein